MNFRKIYIINFIVKTILKRELTIQKVDRPLGLAILAVLEIIGSIVAILGGVILIISGALLADIIA